MDQGREEVRELVGYRDALSSSINACVSYGGLSGGAMNLIVIPVMLIPATWFPDR